MSPPQHTGSKAPSPLASSASPPAPNHELQPISTTALSQLLNRSSTLILDVRAPSAYQSSHLPSSHSIPVPSTLLRRPAFSLQKLGQMLSAQGAEAVSRWKDKSDIVLVDADTSSLPSSGLLEGLSAKFFKEGYTRNVWFVKGGHVALQQSNMPLVSDEDQTSDDASTSGGKGHNMMVGRLDKLAFQQGMFPGAASCDVMLTIQNLRVAICKTRRLNPRRKHRQQSLAVILSHRCQIPCVPSGQSSQTCNLRSTLV